tara:strand:+ start:13916 stop:15028 length:1113 start_codon:yes stop_codon:yes gene_type:complete
MHFKKYRSIFALVATLILLQSNIIAQNKISGKVLDKEDFEPIIGAQIFLSGTTIGTVSNADGHFILDGIPEGIYELLVTSLGYNRVSSELNTSKIKPSYSFTLESQVYELNELTVVPNSEDWKYNFEEFERIFIGEGPFSKDTKIINKEVLNFDFDPTTRVLTAYAYDKLVIENKALGYRISYFLESFTLDYKNKITSYLGRPLFELLTSKRKRTRSKWKKNRALAYNGSFQHFVESLIENKVAENGYTIKGEMRKDGSRYIGKETVHQNVFFAQIDSSNFELSFINFLNVTYENELEDITYLYYLSSPISSNNRMLVLPQTSMLTLNQASVKIHESGYIYDSLAILFDGYWGFEKMSDTVPLNFIPESD